MSSLCRAILAIVALLPPDLERSLLSYGSSCLPSISLTLKPHLIDQNNGLEHARLEMVMVMDVPRLHADQALIAIDLVREIVPSQPYNNQSVQISDQKGILPIRTEDICSDGVPRRTWYLQRATKGRISLKFTAVPRKVNRNTRIAARTDLRYESGGMQGSGVTILPEPAFPKAMLQNWNFKVQWDLSDAPQRTRAIWTFGEGPKVVTHIGPASDLIQSIFSVGHVNSYPALSQDFKTFGMYWFGDLPPNIVAMQKYEETTFHAMSRFWKDPPGPKNAYRIFVRNSAPANGYGGTEFTRSYMLEYDSRIQNITNDDLTQLLTHEMVHNWPHMGKRAGEPGANKANEDGSWFTEGVADYYAGYFPYKIKTRTAEWSRTQVNLFLSQYYTNPAIRQPNAEARRNAWSDANGQMMIYSRGWAYLTMLDEQVRQASKGKRSLDNLVMKMIDCMRRRKDYSMKAWTTLVRKELGKPAVDELHNMVDGSFIKPLPTRSVPPMKLVRQDREVLDVGFNLSSYSSHIVTGLKPGSRAEQAGVREGDKITKIISLWSLAETYEMNNSMTLERDGKSLEVNYWPRSGTTAECYQFV
ncbi:hypothetical protein K461DRAFT_322784 [Myriangium duriaei CBS 260.36]|uniref:PDZ domain-containing protein n=1 Tax=Myriangium duriaei CBS 260.36 TaxID=1168546 RepID=A0A9P4J0U9_9PEZI|nr:hypothetical protein K461DRAFT_322784 [Myriangium duriaei CBS 260.36]